MFYGWNAIVAVRRRNNYFLHTNLFHETFQLNGRGRNNIYTDKLLNITKLPTRLHNKKIFSGHRMQNVMFVYHFKKAF